jgi:hypothetical protein
VIAIYEALEANGDIDEGWRSAKHTAFKKIGSSPDRVGSLAC